MFEDVGDCDPTDWDSGPRLAAFLVAGAEALWEALKACVCLSLRWSCWLWTHSNVHCLFVRAQFVQGPTRSKSSSIVPGGSR